MSYYFILGADHVTQEPVSCKEITTWHKIFAGVYFCGLAIFCVLQELIFAIKTDCSFLL